MAVRKNYKEGDWFAVPLRTGGLAVGIVARSPRQAGTLLGYFFGPVRNGVPRLDEVALLKPRDAILIKMFGDLGLLRGDWPIIGRAVTWQRADWPTVQFGRVDESAKRAWCIEYSDDGENRVLRETPCPMGQAEALPKDGLAGCGALEIVLTKILTEDR